MFFVGCFVVDSRIHEHWNHHSKKQQISDSLICNVHAIVTKIIDQIKMTDNLDSNVKIKIIFGALKLTNNDSWKKLFM